MQVLRGDITRLSVGAIVNAANERMLGGGGVDGAIHRAAGPELLEACRNVPEVRPGVRCPTGEARITPGFRLPARYVIHAATMELGGPTSAEIIGRATESTLAKADELGCRSLALVAFGTGVGGFPLDEAARIMVDAARQHEPGSLERVVFAVHGSDAEAAFKAALAG